MKKVAAAVAATLVMLSLAGCESAAEACEKRGGTYVSTGVETVFITRYIQSGNVMVPIVSQYPVTTYACEGVE